MKNRHKITIISKIHLPAWRIFGKCGNWNAKANIGNGQLIMFDRLSEISEELATIVNGDTL